MFTDPEKNIRALDVRLGMSVADLGSGSGAYIFPLARRVGGKGRAYAVDIQKDLLAKIKNEAARQGLSQVSILWGDLEEEGGTKIHDGILDAAILSNIFFQVSDKGLLAREAKRILKNGGKALVVDWKESFGGLGPTPEEVVPEKEAKRLMEDEGFMFEKNMETGTYHYGMIFKKP